MPQPEKIEVTVQGIAASQGIAYGQIFVYIQTDVEVPSYQVEADKRIEEVSRFDRALVVTPDTSMDDLEMAVLRQIEPVRLLSRLAPMLGLIATMVPLGPALQSVAGGQGQQALEIAQASGVHGCFLKLLDCFVDLIADSGDVCGVLDHRVDGKKRLVAVLRNAGGEHLDALFAQEQAFSQFARFAKRQLAEQQRGDFFGRAAAHVGGVVPYTGVHLEVAKVFFG